MRKLFVILCVSVLIIACSMTQSKVHNLQRNISQDDLFALNKSNVELIERALNVKELEEYLHFEQPNRLPLTLIYKGIKSDEQRTVICFAYQVEMVQSIEGVYQGSVIELSHAYQDSSTTKLIFRYPIEGIKLTIEFELKKNGTWEIFSKRVVEY